MIKILIMIIIKREIVPNFVFNFAKICTFSFKICVYIFLKIYLFCCRVEAIEKEDKASVTIFLGSLGPRNTFKHF